MELWGKCSFFPNLQFTFIRWDLIKAKWSFGGPRQLLFWVLKPVAVLSQHFSTLVVENGNCSQPSVRLRNYSSCSFPVFLFLALRNFLHLLIGNWLSWQGNCCSPYLLASLPCTFFHLDFPEFSALSSHLKAATVLLDISSLSLPGDAAADCLYDLVSKNITLLLCIAVQCLKTTVSYVLFF